MRDDDIFWQHKRRLLKHKFLICKRGRSLERCLMLRVRQEKFWCKHTHFKLTILLSFGQKAQQDEKGYNGCYREGSTRKSEGCTNLQQSAINKINLAKLILQPITLADTAPRKTSADNKERVK